MSNLSRTAAVIGLVLSLISSASAGPVVFGGPSNILDTNGWSWDRPLMADFRAAIEDPANFGPGGIVEDSITTTSLNPITAASLATIDVFVAPFWHDSVQSPNSATIRTWFLGGGSLLLLNDGPDYDQVANDLGIGTSFPSATNGIVNGGGPIFNGPFGAVTDLIQNVGPGVSGLLSQAAITANGGHFATNANGETTVAWWAPGEYAPGAGAMFIATDVALFTEFGGTSQFDPLNANGRLAMNAAAFLTSPVPEPGTGALVGLGVAGLALRRRRRRV